MRKTVVAVALAVALGSAISSAEARNEPGAKYFYGEGDAKRSDVSFIVSEGKVRKVLMGTGRTRCSEGTTTIFKAFAGMRIDGHSFRRKVGSDDAEFLFAGRVHGAEARGRMKARIRTERYGACDSGKVPWAAERVSFEEWRKHRHGYQAHPHD